MKTRNKLLLAAMGIGLALVFGEAMFFVLVKRGYRFNWPTPVKDQTHYKFEIPESLSALPDVRHPTEFFYGGWVTEDSKFTTEGDLWVPPRSYSGEIPMIDRRTGQVVRRIQMHTDAHARRTYSGQENAAARARSHLVAFGCSNTWGYGVDDDEALPARMAARSPSVVSYNLASGGYSVGELLLRARDGDSLEGIGPRDGMAFYAIFNHHLGRFLNSASNIATWRANGISLEETSPGKFVSRGSAAQAEPLWRLFARAFHFLSIGQYFGWDLPMENRERVDRFVRAIAALREVYWAKTSPHNPFAVVFLPYVFDNTLWRESLDRHGIPFVDYTHVHIEPKLRTAGTRPGESHPSPEALDVLAMTLNRDLSNYFFKK